MLTVNIGNNQPNQSEYSFHFLYVIFTCFYDMTFLCLSLFFIFFKSFPNRRRPTIFNSTLDSV